MFVRILALAVALSMVTGCYVTKVVSVPLRVVGAVTSVVPVAGNTMHDSIDDVADTIDDL